MMASLRLTREIGYNHVSRVSRCRPQPSPCPPPSQSGPSGAGPGPQARLELGKLAEAAAVEQKGDPLDLDDGPGLVAREYVLPVEHWRILTTACRTLL